MDTKPILDSKMTLLIGPMWKPFCVTRCKMHMYIYRQYQYIQCKSNRSINVIDVTKAMHKVWSILLQSCGISNIDVCWCCIFAKIHYYIMIYLWYFNNLFVIFQPQLQQNVLILLDFVLFAYSTSMALREHTQIARFMGPTWGPPGADRTQVGPMLAPWSLLSG